MEQSIAQRKIILMEDDPDIAWLVQLHLEQAGYRVHTIDDGDKGLSEFLASGADLMLLDIDLPGLSGWEVYTRIREVSPIPIIMLTAYPQQQHDLPQTFGCGADAYVGKPFTFGELLSEIRAFLP